MMYLTFYSFSKAEPCNRGTVENTGIYATNFLKRLPFIGGRMWNGGTFHTDDKSQLI